MVLTQSSVSREAPTEAGTTRLAVEVADDGSGGAGVRSGGGLQGLADRVAALDGRLMVESPRKAGRS